MKILLKWIKRAYSEQMIAAESEERRLYAMKRAEKWRVQYVQIIEHNTYLQANIESLWDRIARLEDQKANLEAVKKERDEAVKFIKTVRDWESAYPGDIFTVATPEQIDDVCKTLGIRIDNISAVILREVSKGWSEGADRVLSSLSKDKDKNND